MEFANITIEIEGETLNLEVSFAYEPATPGSDVEAPQDESFEILNCFNESTMAIINPCDVLEGAIIDAIKEMARDNF